MITEGSDWLSRTRQWEIFCDFCLQRNDRGRGGRDDVEYHVEGSPISQHGYIRLVEERLADGKEISLQYVEGVGYVQTEIDQPEIQSAAAGATGDEHVGHREVRTG